VSGRFFGRGLMFSCGLGSVLIVARLGQALRIVNITTLSYA
jgi:hypothetical protein